MCVRHVCTCTRPVRECWNNLSSRKKKWKKNPTRNPKNSFFFLFRFLAPWSSAGASLFLHHFSYRICCLDSDHIFLAVSYQRRESMADKEKCVIRTRKFLVNRLLGRKQMVSVFHYEAEDTFFRTQKKQLLLLPVFLMFFFVLVVWSYMLLPPLILWEFNSVFICI